jgi:hypothetical protein
MDAQLYIFGLLSKDKNRPFSLGAQKKDALIKRASQKYFGCFIEKECMAPSRPD